MRRIDPVSWVLNGMKRLDQKSDEMISLSYGVHSCVVALTKGQATRDDLTFLLSSAKVCKGLVDLGIAVEYLPQVELGMQSVLDVANRGWEQNHFVVKAVELNAINTMVEIHDAQLEIVTMSELENVVKKLMKTKHTIVAAA